MLMLKEKLFSIDKVRDIKEKNYLFWRNRMFGACVRHYNEK